MIFRGGVYIVECKDEVRERIKSWATKGSNNFNKNALAILGFQVEIREITPTKLLLAFSNNTIFNFRIPFLIVFMFMARKIKRDYQIRIAKQVELYNIYEEILCKTK
jgi:hypothetical protein